MADLQVAHEALSLATLAALVIHGLTLIGDGYLHPSLGDIAIPFLSGYTTFWTRHRHHRVLGCSRSSVSPITHAPVSECSAGADLHRFTALAWILGLAHSLGEGTDAGQTWFLAMTVDRRRPGDHAFARVFRLRPWARRSPSSNHHRLRLPNARQQLHRKLARLPTHPTAPIGVTMDSHDSPCPPPFPAPHADQQNARARAAAHRRRSLSTCASHPTIRRQPRRRAVQHRLPRDLRAARLRTRSRSRRTTPRNVAASASTSQQAASKAAQSTSSQPAEKRLRTRRAPPRVRIERSTPAANRAPSELRFG